MDTIEKLVQRVQKTQHGFADIKRAADEIVADKTPKESERLARKLFDSEVHQARMLATLVFRRLTAKSGASLKFLRNYVSKDGD